MVLTMMTDRPMPSRNRCSVIMERASTRAKSRFAFTGTAARVSVMRRSTVGIRQKAMSSSTTATTLGVKSLCRVPKNPVTAQAVRSTPPIRAAV